MSEFNPQRIEILRGLKGWTIEHLAQVSGVSKRRVSDMARELVLFREQDAEAFALASGFPLSFFTLEEEPIPAMELTFRAPSRTSAREKRRVNFEFEVLKGTIRRTAAIAKFEKRSDWIDAVAPENTPDLHDIDDLASEVRLRLGLNTSGPVPNVMWAIESGGIAVVPMMTTARAEETRSEGLSCPKSTLGPATIGYFPGRRSGDGIRFTVSHELGHLILQRKRRPSSRAVIEREASLFAGAFLLPRQDALSVFSPRMTLDDFLPIKAHYGVSVASLIMQSIRRGLIDKDRQQSLMTQMSIRRWRKSEPVEVEEEHPLLFKQLLGKACGRINTATSVEVNSELAEQFTGMPFEYLNVWADGISKIRPDWDTSFMRQF